MRTSKSRKGNYFFQLYKAHYRIGDVQKASEYFDKAESAYDENDAGLIDFYSTAGWLEVLYGDSVRGEFLSEMAIKSTLEVIETRRKTSLPNQNADNVIASSQVDTRDLAWVKLKRLLYVDCTSDVYQESLSICSFVAKTDARLRAFLIEALKRKC